MYIVLSKNNVECEYLRFLMYKIFFQKKWYLKEQRYFICLDYILDLRFVLVYFINNQLGLKFGGVLRGYWIRHTKSECNLFLQIHKGHFVVKTGLVMLLLNAKAIWYTKLSNFSLINNIRTQIHRVIFYSKPVYKYLS